MADDTEHVRQQDLGLEKKARKRKRKLRYELLSRRGNIARYSQLDTGGNEPSGTSVAEEMSGGGNITQQASSSRGVDILEIRQGTPSPTTDSDDPEYIPTPRKKHLVKWESQATDRGMHF